MLPNPRHDWPNRVRRVIARLSCCSKSMAYPFVIVSSRFSSTLPSAVQAANSLASRSAGRGDSPALVSLVAAAGFCLNLAHWVSKIRVRISSSCGSRSAGRAKLEGKGQPLGRRGAAFLQNPLAEHAGRLDVGRIVQQHQGLQRRIGARPGVGADFAIGGVERHHRRIGQGPLPVGVNSATIEIDAVALHVALRP